MSLDVIKTKKLLDRVCKNYYIILERENMGTLAEVVKQFDAGGDQKEESIECLNLLMKLAKEKEGTCRREIEGSLSRGRILGKDNSANSLFYPISCIRDVRVEYRCITQNTTTDLVNEVTEAIGGIIDDHTGGGIVNGIASVISGDLEQLLEITDGEDQSCSVTTTFIDGEGGTASIVRLDCVIWAYSVKSESLKKKIDKVLVCVAYKSLADVSKIAFDDFIAMYTPIIQQMEKRLVMEEVKRARDMYSLLGGGSALPRWPG